MPLILVTLRLKDKMIGITVKDVKRINAGKTNAYPQRLRLPFLVVKSEIIDFLILSNRV